ncbi:MAG: protein-L-isoaspartate O-methyltransferase [Chlorobi bacterium OLB4]|nr:MAG: protein-L-isoaspartate O-methyltransferase [Chlorobi bacterium OLB4]MBV6398427.1 Protein-L-isoaspartate O-methyltransferase [Ignavibacteria bacterium]
MIAKKIKIEMHDLRSEERAKLVEELKSLGISNTKLLKAFLKVRRELFVGKDFLRFAYDNNALPINSNQTISQPFTVAYMTQLLDVKDNDKVLEIGTGSGYQAAILCEMGADVYSVERLEDLHQTAKERLNNLGYKVKLKCADGSRGWREYAPYNKIIVTAGSPKIPKSLLEQLSDNGKLVIPVGDEKGQVMYEVIKKMTDEGEPKYLYKTFDDFRFVPLIGEEAWDDK